MLAEGIQVSIHGRISLYEARGAVQLVGDLVMPAGAGALALALEELRLKLEQQDFLTRPGNGPCPPIPKSSGWSLPLQEPFSTTYATCWGAGGPWRRPFLLRPLYRESQRRPAIVSALESLNRDGRSDLIILARGGGSLEELWPFNEESVARAIYASRIPVISAIGHETDFTIADDVADLRAPTPSVAAELAVPDARVLAADLETPNL